MSVLQEILVGQVDNPIGLYRKDDDSLADAQGNIMEKMLRLLSSIKRSTRILILGAGYGDVARHIAAEYKCKVDCLNPNPEQNQHNKRQVEAMELGKFVTLIEGGLDKIPFEHEHYDYIWSQGQLLFHEDAQTLFRSVQHVLKPEGRFVFTVPTRTPSLKGDVVEAITGSDASQLHFRSPEDYVNMAKRADLGKVIAIDKPQSLLRHFQNLKANALESKEAASSNTEQDKLEQIIHRYDNWIKAVELESLGWGIFLFQKRNA